MEKRGMLCLQRRQCYKMNTDWIVSSIKTSNLPAQLIDSNTHMNVDEKEEACDSVNCHT